MTTHKPMQLLPRKSILPTLLSLFYLLVISCFATVAQTSTEKPVYVNINYIKTEPGKQGAYLDLLKNYSKKVYDHNFKEGRALAYYVSSLVMPSGSSAEYDVAVMAISFDLQMIVDDSVSARDILKSLNPDQSDAFLQAQLDQYGKVRTIVKREIFTPIAHLAPNSPETKYFTVDYMKTAPGKNADYIKIEKDVWMPIHRERAKMGVLTDWVLMEKMMPFSTSDAYDYATFNFFDNMKFFQDSKYNEAIKKAFPTADVNKSMAATNASRTLVREELWKLEFYVNASNTKK